MKHEKLVKDEVTGEYRWVEIKNTENIHRNPEKVYSTAYHVSQVSDAMAVHSNQVNEFNEMYKAAGVTGARHLPNGQLEYDSNHARNEVMKMRGLYDRDAGYGQWAGNAVDECY